VVAFLVESSFEVGGFFAAGSEASDDCEEAGDSGDESSHADAEQMNPISTNETIALLTVRLLSAMPE
jgi:hypothetical protein